MDVRNGRDGCVGARICECRFGADDVNGRQQNFEVISVDGNKVVYRDQNGTNEITVPSDFRFTVDGKPMSVADLKPGMKGTATVTTTTTIKPVVVTEVREGEVLRASDLSMTVRQADGNTRRFTQGELDKRGIEIVKDGKAVRIADLKKGDKLSATIITSGPPVVLTETEVKAVLAEAGGRGRGRRNQDGRCCVRRRTPAAAPAKASAAPPPSQPAESSGMGMTWLWIAIAVAVVLFLRSCAGESRRDLKQRQLVSDFRCSSGFGALHTGQQLARARAPLRDYAHGRVKGTSTTCTRLFAMM